MYTILHNPQCSKSRATLKILENNKDTNIELTIREYLKDPLSLAELETIFTLLEKPFAECIRQKEPFWKDKNIDSQNISDQEILKIVSKNPSLLERPIVLLQNDNIQRAIIGRPPENVLELL